MAIGGKEAATKRIETTGSEELGAANMFSARQYEIAAFLKKSQGYIPVREIAELLQVSQKTVRNEVNTIRRQLAEMGLGTIESKAHVGIRLVITEECWEKFNVRVEERKEQRGSDRELTFALLCEILKQRTVSYHTLEARLCITRPVVERLLPRAGAWLEDNGIRLEKEKGTGLCAKMPLLKERYIWSAALIRLGAEREKRDGLFAAERMAGRPAANPLSFCEGFMEGFAWGGVIDAIKKTEECFGLRFTYEGFWQAALMISLSVRQIRRRQALDLFASRSGKTDSEFDEMVAAYLIASLERNYGIVVPMTERDYIAYTVQVVDIQNFTDLQAKLFCQSRSLELCRFTVKMASLLEDITGQELKKDDYFVESLFLQLRSMIARCRYELRQRNPLVKQVRQKYNDIFVTIHGVAVFLEKELGIVMNEDDTCSLALLLGGALLRGNAVVDACVICNYYGIGSAHLLKNKLEREVNDLRIVAEYSARDMAQVGNCECDLIISALPVENPFYGKPVVRVEDMLLDYDIAAIESVMKEIRRKKTHSKALSHIFKARRGLFYEKFVWLHMEGSDKYAVIETMCDRLADAGYVTEDFKKSVLSHERKISTDIGQRMAIPHGCAAHVIRSVAAVAFLEKEIRWGEEEFVDRVFLLAFDPDESPGMKDKILRFYKNFVILLDEPEVNERMRRAGSKKALADMMNELIA